MDVTHNTEMELSCATLLKVLADETRLAVMQQLLAKPMHVRDMNETLKIEQTLLSHHLKVLRDAGLVVTQREGKSVRYSLAPNVEALSAKNAINLGCCQLSFNMPKCDSTIDMNTQHEEQR